MCVCMCCVTRPLLIEFHNLYVLCELCVKTAREIKEDGSEVAKCARNLGRGCKVHWEGDSNQRAKSTRGVSVGHAASHAGCVASIAYAIAPRSRRRDAQLQQYLFF